MSTKRFLRIFFTASVCLMLAGICFLFFRGEGFNERKLNAENQSLVEKSVQLEQKRMHIGESELSVEVADTVEKRERGLSGHRKLLENEGMLFIFEKSDRWMFWMKNMNFAIDILWISESGTVSEITRDVSPESYPNVFSPQDAAKFVLEVSSGWAERHGIREGDAVNW